MTDLEKFRAEPPPRSDAFCRDYRGIFAPVFGMVMWGIVYAFFTPLVPAIALYGYAVMLQQFLPGLPQPLPGLALAGMAAVALISFTVAWLPFVVLMRRWRGRALRLFRDGELVDGKYHGIRHRTDENGHVHTHCSYRFIHEGMLVTTEVGYPGERFEPEFDTLTVLYHPELAFGVSFPNGKLVIIGRGGLKREPVATGAMI